MVKKTDNTLSCFHLIPERYGQTDGQNCYINIACQCADAQKNLKNDTLTRTPDPIRPTRWSPVPNHPTELPPRGFCPGAGNVSVVISHYWLFSIPVR